MAKAAVEKTTEDARAVSEAAATEPVVGATATEEAAVRSAAADAIEMPHALREQLALGQGGGQAPETGQTQWKWMPRLQEAPLPGRPVLAKKT